MYGSWIDYCISSQLSIQAGGTYLRKAGGWLDDAAKSTLGFHAGVKWYFSNNVSEKNYSGYIGAFYHEWIYFRQGVSPDVVAIGSIYLPLGIEYIGDDGFTATVEIALDPVYLAYLMPWAGVKIGWHF